MSDVLRGGVNTLGIPGATGDFKLQLKRPKAKNTQNVPELVAKFGELKRKMLDLARENESLKEQLLKAHETNSLLSQENTQLKQKQSQVLDVEATIDQSIEELLFAADGIDPPKVVEVSKIPRPVRFTLARKEAPPVAETPVAAPPTPTPTMRGEVKVRSSTVSIPATPITKKENIPSPFEVVDLTLVKKDEPLNTPASEVRVPVPKVVVPVVEAPAPKPIEAKVEKPVSFFPAVNILEENKLKVTLKEKPSNTKAKFEAVNDVTMEDVSKFLLGVKNLPAPDKKIKVIEFLNLDIMPKVFSPKPKENKPKDIVGDKVAKLTHLTEAEKARLYADLNTTIDDFYLKDLTSNGVLYI